MLCGGVVHTPNVVEVLTGGGQGKQLNVLGDGLDEGLTLH